MCFKISENKKDKHLIIIMLCIIVALTILVPAALEYIIFRNNIESAISNGEWSGFFGSFIGGIIGGAGTLVAVYVTTQHTNKIQSNTDKQIEIDRKRDEHYKKKVFCDEVANTVSEYITDISKYFYDCRFNEGKSDEEDKLLKKIEDFNKEINELYNRQMNISDTHELLDIDAKINIFKNNRSDVERDLYTLRRDMDKNQTNRIVSVNCYYLLKIKLGELKEANELLDILEVIHKESSFAKSLELNWIKDNTELLIEKTKKFIIEYTVA